MTTAAQNALRRVIEKYTKNVRFCLICNYVGKIIPAIQSRCTRFRFAPLSPIVVMDRIKMVMREENVVIDQDGLDAVVGLSKGDMRRALNILQAANASHNEITLDTIYQCTGNVHPNDVSHVFDLLLNSDFTECYNRILQLKTSRGIALVDLIQKIHELVMEIEFPDNVLIMLIDGLAVIEARLAVACDERIQLGALVGLFKMALELK